MNEFEIKHNQIMADIKKGKTISPLKAIKFWCLECNGYNREEVKTCTIDDCILSAFKFGKNTTAKKRVLSEKEKEVARARFKKALKRK